MDLYTILKNSYDTPSKQKTALDKYGFNYQANLSSRKFQTYFNPETKMLLFSVRGTDPTSFADIRTDAALAFGNLKSTKRYKDADAGLKKAKQTLSPTKTIVFGHSLGGTIAGYIASKSDKVYTLDKGATIGQKTRSNETALRTEGDLVSGAIANSKNVTTIKKNNYGITDYLGGAIGRALSSHNLDQIKDSKIEFVKPEEDYKIISKDNV